jgi:outer membrane cobalamin receptor
MYTKSKVKSQKSKVPGQKSIICPNRFFLAFIFSFFIFHFSFALDAPHFYGNEVVVTASRLPEPRGASPWDTAVIDSTALKNYKTVGDALRTVAGADVISYGSLGSLTSVRLRGANSSQVLILVDGRRINSPTLGMFDTGDLLVDNIERIEVVRAPLSAVYGSDAISGVINIITKSPKEAVTSVSAQTGSFATTQYKLSVAGDQYLFSFDELRSAGFRANGDYLADNFYGKVVQPTPLGQLFADYSLYGAQKGVPGVPTSEADPTSASQPTDRQADRNMLSSVGIKSDSYQLRAYQNSLDEKMDPFASGVSTNEALENGLEWNQTFALFGNKILYGLETRSDRGQTSLSGDHTITNHAVFVQDEVRLGPTSLIVSVRSDRHSTAGNSINPRAGLTFQLSDSLLFRASAGSAFRAPTLNELYWNDPNNPYGAMFGDPNLKPEKSVSYDLGLEKQLSDNTTARLNYFNSNVTDMILWNYNFTTGQTQVENIGQVANHGAEFELERKIGENGKGFINYTYQTAVNQLTNKTIPYTPANKYSVGVVSGKTSLVVRSVGERYIDAGNLNKLPAYTVVDFNYVKSMGSCELNFAVNNLFDEKYSEIVGSYHIPGTFIYESRNYPMPGRSYSLGLTWSL